MTTEYPEISLRTAGEKRTDLDQYKCWFEYLQESNEQDWAEEVRRDFGNVKNTSFEVWWPDHKHLFQTITPLVIEEMVSQEDLTHCDENGWIDDEAMAVIAIHMYLPKKEILAAFESWLKKRKKYQRTDPNDELSMNYGFSRVPDTLMLREALRTYKLVESESLKPEAEQRAYCQLETELNLVNKKNWINLRTKADKKSQRKTQKQTVYRYHSIAKQILEGVVMGEFPVYKENKSKKKANTPPEAASK